MENKHWTCLDEIFKAVNNSKIRHAKLPNNDFRLCQKINYAVSLNVLFYCFKYFIQACPVLIFHIVNFNIEKNTKT